MLPTVLTSWPQQHPEECRRCCHHSLNPHAAHKGQEGRLQGYRSRLSNLRNAQSCAGEVKDRPQCHRGCLSRQCTSTECGQCIMNQAHSNRFQTAKPPTSSEQPRWLQGILSQRALRQSTDSAPPVSKLSKTSPTRSQWAALRLVSPLGPSR